MVYNHSIMVVLGVEAVVCVLLKYIARHGSSAVSLNEFKRPVSAQ